MACQKMNNVGLSLEFIFGESYLNLFSNLFSPELLFRIYDIILLEVSRNRL